MFDETPDELWMPDEASWVYLGDVEPAALEHHRSFVEDMKRAIAGLYDALNLGAKWEEEKGSLAHRPIDLAIIDRIHGIVDALEAYDGRGAPLRSFVSDEELGAARAALDARIGHLIKGHPRDGSLYRAFRLDHGVLPLEW